MKRIIPLLIIILATGCVQNQEQKQTATQKTQQTKEVAEATRVDTVFLGFTFGMSRDQVVEKVRALINDGTLNRNASGDIRYSFSLNESGLSTVKAGIAPRYYDDQLCELGLIVEPDSFLGQETTYYLIVDLYLNKYGAPEFHDESKTTWLDHNRKIEIVPVSGDIMITYTDVPVQKKIDQQKKERFKETQKDI